VVVVVQDDHLPVAADPRAGAGHARAFDRLRRHGPTSHSSPALRRVVHGLPIYGSGTRTFTLLKTASGPPLTSFRLPTPKAIRRPSTWPGSASVTSARRVPFTNASIRAPNARSRTLLVASMP